MIAYHLIFGAYGFSTRESLARREHDHALRLRAKQSLKYPAVRFTGLQARAVGRGFAQIVHELGVEAYDCVVMPDHAHLVTAKHRLVARS
jgi:hypothetical protein